MTAAVPADADDEVAEVPRSLLRGMLADPAAVPEELAAFALRVKGPKAQAAVDRLRVREPEAGPEELRARLTTRGVRACAYYFGTPDAVTASAAGTADVGMVASAVRAVLSVLVSVGLLLLVLLTDLKLFGGKWPLLALVLLGASVLAGAWWFLRRRAR